MAKKAIVELELLVDGYKASLGEITKANQTISESANKAAQTAQQAFVETGKAAANAFANNELKKALADNVAGANKLSDSLDELTKSTKKTDESVKLLVKDSKDLEKFEARLRELSLAGDRSSKEFTDLAKAIGTYRSSIIAADRAVDLYAKSTDAATGRIGELEDKLYDLALAGQANTKEFKDLVKEVALVRRAVIETDAQVDNLAQRGSGIKAFAQSVELVGVAFQAAEGAQALFGTDSEELQRTLVRLNAIMAITSAIEQGRQILLEQITAKTGLAAAATKVYTFVTTGATVATKAWRGALVATGIGAVIAILGSLASSFMDVGEATDEAAEKARDYQKAIEGVEKGAGDSRTRLANAQIKASQLEGKLNERTANRLIANNNLQQAITNNNIAAKEKENEAFKRFEEQKLEDIKMFGRLSKVTTKQLNIDLNNIEFERAKTEQALRIESSNAIIEAERKATKEVKKEKGQILTLLDDELIKRDLLEKLTLKTLSSLVKSSKFEDTTLQTQARTRQNFIKTTELLEGSTLARRITLIELEGKRRKADTFDQIEDAKERQTAIELIEAETQAAIRAERQKTLDDSIRQAFEYADAFAQALSSLNQLSRQVSENNIAEIQRRQEVELAGINNTLQTERQKERQREALALRTNQKLSQEKQKQARQDKALAIFEATINVAKAVTQVIANPPLAILVGIAGAAQIAAIAARPIPKFEKGGLVKGKRHSQGGEVIEAEDMEFVTNRKQTTRHRSELEAMNRSTAEYHRLIQRNYVRPAIARVLSDRKSEPTKVTVNATLNSKKMESELKGLRSDIRKSKQRNYSTSTTDSRYQWHNN